MIARAAQAGQGWCPVSKVVRALPQAHVNGTALHQASHIPGSGGFLPIFLPEEAAQGVGELFLLVTVARWSR